jgi:hypothetical protein
MARLARTWQHLLTDVPVMPVFRRAVVAGSPGRRDDADPALVPHKGEPVRRLETRTGFEDLPASPRHTLRASIDRGWNMSAAEKRIAELLDRWLASVELHARYLKLDDAAYASAQDWPKHQRPTKWVVELARTRLVDLQQQLAARRSKGDTAFAESLELMGFLTTLLGSEHVERFIPQATAQPAPPTRREKPAGTADSGVHREPAAATKAATASKSTGDTTTRQKLAVRQRAAAAPKPGDRKAGDRMTATVIADAVRFLSWGREWPQLASSVARLADRPPEDEVRRILVEHRAAIEARARSAPP